MDPQILPMSLCFSSASVWPSTLTQNMARGYGAARRLAALSSPAQESRRWHFLQGLPSRRPGWLSTESAASCLLGALFSPLCLESKYRPYSAGCSWPGASCSVSPESMLALPMVPFSRSPFTTSVGAFISPHKKSPSGEQLGFLNLRFSVIQGNERS